MLGLGENEVEVLGYKCRIVLAIKSYCWMSKEKDATRRGLGERKAFIGDFLGRRVVDGFAR